MLCPTSANRSSPRASATAPTSSACASIEYSPFLGASDLAVPPEIEGHRAPPLRRCVELRRPMPGVAGERVDEDDRVAAAAVVHGELARRPGDPPAHRRGPRAGPPRPGRPLPQDPPMHRAALRVRPGQIPDAHQELAHDLAAGEAEGALEELHPLLLRSRMVGGEPAGERPVALPQLEDARRVGDGRVDLEPVAHDARIGQQPPPVARAVGRDHVGIEPVVGPAERFALLEDGEPGEAGLVDLQHQPLEQRRVVVERKAVLVIVVGPVPLVARRDVAVRGAHSR